MMSTSLKFAQALVAHSIVKHCGSDVDIPITKLTESDLCILG